jgi:single-strand DNA-binding protein
MNTDMQLFIGRLGRNPELKYTPKGKPVCYLSVAVNKEEDQVDWKKVVVWERQAELCSVQLKKGSEVFVYGKGKLESYINKTGEEKQYEEVNARLVGFSNI